LTIKLTITVRELSNVEKNIFCISALLFLVVITRIILITYAPHIYFFDAYTYVKSAEDFVHFNSFNYEVGLPFILSLGISLKLFSWLSPILVAQGFMVCFSAIVVVLLFLIGRKMAGTFFGFIAAVLASFEQYFLSFSIVPHNDIFAIALGLSAFYFATTTNKIRYVLSPVLFYLAVATRPEFYPIFGIPILMLIAYRGWNSNFRKKITLLFYASAIYVAPIFWINIVMPLYTRFSVVERIGIFLKPSLFDVVFNSVFNFYLFNLINEFFIVIAILAIIVWLTKYFHLRNYKSLTLPKLGTIRDQLRALFNSGSFIALCVLIVFVVYLLVLVVFAFGYTIIDGTVIVDPTLPVRYIIVPRLLLSFAFVYPFSLLAKVVYFRIVKK
jgi:hypothetical protein